MYEVILNCENLDGNSLNIVIVKTDIFEDADRCVCNLEALFPGIKVTMYENC